MSKRQMVVEFGFIIFMFLVAYFAIIILGRPI